MTFSWMFKEATPGDRARESKVEDFFKSDAVRNRANAVVREGIQNSLDAAPNGVRVRVRIHIGGWSGPQVDERLPAYERGFAEHVEAEGVRNKLPGLPSSGEPFRYLVFEDFGTSGLTGDPAEWWPDEHDKSGPFFKFFRAEGISGKDDHARGRHGVGRLVFMFASRVRTMYGLTRRAGDAGSSDELLMGTTVLRNHRVDGKPYLPDGWFGTPSPETQGLTLPIDDASVLAEFKRDFEIARTVENGLSIVVPWLTDDITYDALIDAVLSEYYYPILEGGLSVDVSCADAATTTISRESAQSILATRGRDFSARYAPLIELAKDALAAEEWLELPVIAEGAPRWHKDVVSEDAAESIQSVLEDGRRIHLRVPVVVRPKDGSPRESEFKLILERDTTLGESHVQFIREGILVSDVRPRRTTGCRALVVIGAGPLGDFLGNAENPSHTQWQKDMVKERYTYAPGLLDYVVHCVPGLLAEVSKLKTEADDSLLLDLFSIPAEEGKGRPVARPVTKPGTESDKPVIDIERRPRSYTISRHGTGFSVRPGDPTAPRPGVLVIRCAYDVRRGNPFSKYSASDFRIGEEGIEISASGCSVSRVFLNSVTLKIDADDFEFSVKGFDVSHRDLVIDVRSVTTSKEPAVGVEG